MEYYFVRLLFAPAAVIYYLFARSMISSPYRKMRKKAEQKKYGAGFQERVPRTSRFLSRLWFTGLNAKKNATLQLNKIASASLIVLVFSHVMLGWIVQAVPFFRYVETLCYIAQIPFMWRALATDYRKRYGTALFLFRKSENKGVDSSLFFLISALFPAAMALSLWLI